MSFVRRPGSIATPGSSSSAPRFAIHSRYLLITITLTLAGHQHLHAQQITLPAPATPLESRSSSQPSADQLTAPETIPPDYPTALPITPPLAPGPIVHTDNQTYAHGVITLDGNVTIDWQDRHIEADHIEYDSNTGELTATGHLLVTAQSNSEIIHASHGSFNLKTLTGRFFEVSGSVGLKPQPSARRTIYTSSNPFLFSGRILVKTGPQAYDIYDGTVTSCQLPHPDWLLSAGHFSITGTQASARNSTFRLLNVPVLFLPYVTHPTDSNHRQSGFLIPTIGQSSTRGLTLGEQVYLTLGRSADLTVGAEYYSSIGFAQNATFRYRGANLNFITLHYAGVLDRRPALTNRGGEEIVLAGRHDFTPYTRAATNIDYLSSYLYREAFTDTFNQAVNSDIISTAYITRAAHGYETAALFDRYQGIKLVAQGSTPQQQVRIFHAPALSFATTDHRLGSTGLQLSMESSAAGLKRSQPNFATGGIVERFDLHPQVAYPIHLAQWNFLPAIAARETVYSRSRIPPQGGRPVREGLDAISRSDFEFSFAIRPPVLTRSFTPTHLNRLLGSEFRHTLEPEVTYRLTKGVSGFQNILRFDATDIVANTNELEYGLTQHIYRRARKPQAGRDGACPGTTIALAPGLNAEPENPFDFDIPITGCPADDLISWRLTQKYFFDERFGGAVVNGRRNIFDTTLNLSGVAFLTEPRAISPLISRLRVRTSAHTDVEWDFDFDTGALRFTSSNVFLDLHQGNSFAALSYARLDAPGRFFTQSPDPGTGANPVTGVSTATSDFNQLRLLGGYGNPVKPGLSVAANLGLDLKSLYGATTQNTSATGVVTSTTVYPALLQYAAIQTAYNWNCCGLAIEYRKFELGSVRNEGSYKFNFTLANIGAAGNLRRAERLF